MNWPIFILALFPGILVMTLFVKEWIDDDRMIRAGRERNEAELMYLIENSYTDADMAWLDSVRIADLSEQ